MTEQSAIGRDQEVAMIRRAADQAAQRRPHFVYIEGFMGVGKSRMLHKALEPYRHWETVPIVLDRHCSTDPMALLRDIVRRPGDTFEELNRDDTVHLVLERASARRSPAVFTIMNAHWADDDSAAAILRICSLLRDAPVLIVMSARPSPRSAVGRLAGFARDSPNASYIRLDPFLPADTKTQLEQFLNTPISAELVAAVHEETAGYPLLIREVGANLAAAPIGTRRLSTAIAAVRTGQSATRMRRALEEMLAPVPEETIAVLELLAASAQPLSQRQLEQAIDSPIDFSGLLETGLAVWDDTQLGFHPRNRLISGALLDRLSTQQLAEVHTTLSSVTDGPQALHHRTEAAAAHPDSCDAEPLIEKLRELAAQSLRRGDPEKSCQSLFRVAQLRPDVRALREMMQIAIPLGHVRQLRTFKEAIQALGRGPLRQAGLALLAVDANDLVSAVEFLEAQPRVDCHDEGALVFAIAVSHVTARLGMSRWAGRAAGVKMQTLMMLAALDENLRQRIEGGEVHRETKFLLEWERAYAAGLRSLIELWQLLDHRDPRMMLRTVEEISAEIHRLGEVPGADVFQPGLLAGRGNRLRQLSDPVTAYADLSRVVSSNAPAMFLTYAQTQLARLLCGAGFWEEAKDLSRSAAGGAMVEGEDASALMAYVTWALVPVSQGRHEEVEPLIQEITAVRKDSGPAVCAALDYLQVWKAIIAGDHESALQFLLRMREDLGGWWDFGVDPLLLLTRSAHYVGRRTLVSEAHQAVLSGELPAREECRVPITAYMEALQSWADRDPERAIERLLKIIRWFDLQPHLRPGQQAAGGHRMHRAFTYLDMGALVLAHPEALRRHRATVMEGLEEAATFFGRVGSEPLMRLAIEGISSLRPRLGGGSAGVAPLTCTGQAGNAEPYAEATSAAEPESDPLDGLSTRERQVAILIAEGNTNKEIAEELVVSVRTVDFHVGNVLAKLRLASRRDVRQQLRGQLAGLMGT